MNSARFVNLCPQLCLWMPLEPHVNDNALDIAFQERELRIFHLSVWLFQCGDCGKWTTVAPPPTVTAHLAAVNVNGLPKQSNYQCIMHISLVCSLNVNRFFSLQMYKLYSSRPPDVLSVCWLASCSAPPLTLSSWRLHRLTKSVLDWTINCPEPPRTEGPLVLLLLKFSTQSLTSRNHELVFLWWVSLWSHRRHWRVSR